MGARVVVTAKRVDSDEIPETAVEVLPILIVVAYRSEPNRL